MQMLFIAPYPPSRIRVRSYGFIKQLQRNHEVTVVTLCRTEREMADVEALRNQGYEVVMVRESKQQAMLRSGMALARSRSMHVAYAQSTSFKEAIQFLCLQRHFDIVHVEHLRGIAAIESILHTYPLVWDAVDCISLLYKQTSIAGPSLSVRTMAKLEHRRIQQFEAKMLKMLQHIVVTSQRDRQAMVDLQNIQTENVTRDVIQSGAAIHVLPNGVDLEYFHPANVPYADAQQHSCNVVFSGKMNYHPNLATIFYLYQQIMPLIWKHRPEATLTIVGSDPPKEVQRLANDPRVEVTGYVDDLRIFIGSAKVMLCPMIYGTGIQNKVLEAMALGTPVVVTPEVAEALGTRPDRDLFIAESPQRYAEIALRLLDDAELRAAISHNGRAYVEQHHNWEVATKRLETIYQNAFTAWSEMRFTSAL